MSDQLSTPAPTAAAARAPACTLVIFGAHGDLTRRLLLPALYNLRAGNLLAEEFRVMGVDHNDRTDAQWRAEMSEAIGGFVHDRMGDAAEQTELDQASWDWLAERLEYLTGDFQNQADFLRLAERLEAGGVQNVVFYLATADRFFGTIIDHLASVGLLAERPGQFRRLVIEKPFGHDLASAQALNKRLLHVLEEQQIYRIDHFLGKETVQNILALRFANGIFEPLWRRDHIDHIQITAAETVGVGTRGKFYDGTGVIRDMVPNHLFQLLAMVAMEPPTSFEAEAVRSEKSKVLQAIRPVRPDDVVRGQYVAGAMAGQAVPGYLFEENIPPGSTTETYVAMRLEVENWRWAGVPIYLRTGKRMTTRRTEIAVHFRQAPYALFRDTPVDKLTPNILRLHIQPREGWTLGLSAKMPGPMLRLAGVNMGFRYEDAFRTAPNTGYETLLYDCLIGDTMLFQRADNIEAGWAVVDPALRAEIGPDDVRPYFSGSSGPAEAEGLLRRAGHRWLSLGPIPKR